MSDTPRIDEELKNNCYTGLNLDFMRNLERELNETKEILEKTKGVLARTIEARDTLWNERFKQQDDTPRFKPKDKVWIMDDNKPTELEIDHFVLDGEHRLFYVNQMGHLFNASNAFATKQELIESL